MKLQGFSQLVLVLTACHLWIDSRRNEVVLIAAQILLFSCVFAHFVVLLAASLPYLYCVY
jgi:predicted membrane protein